MSFTIRQAAFFLIFTCLFSLLSIFGETAQSFWIVGAMVLLLLPYIKEAKNLPVSAQSQWLVSLLFIAWVWLSLFWSISLPLSISRAIFISLGLLIFWFFRTRHEEFFSLNITSFFLLSIGATLAIFQLVSLVWPLLISRLPPVSLLATTYGHAHTSALLLLSLPLAIHAVIQKKKLGWLLLLLYAAALISSFGRITILLTISEFLGCMYLFRSQISLRTRVTLRWLTVLFGALLLVMAAFSLIPQLSYGEKCVVPILRIKLCKSVIDESRPEFWHQAITAVIQRPLTGWGGGTFSIISRQLADLGTSYSAFAHNEHLQIAEEYGLIGLVLFLIVLYFPARVIITSVTKYRVAHPLVVCLSIGWIALSADALFDYNWNFYAIWLSYMIVAAAVMRQVESERFPAHLSHRGKVSEEIIQSLSAQLKKINAKLNAGFKPLLALISAPILIWSGLYIISSLLWLRGYADASLRLFPLVYWRVEDALMGKVTVSSETNDWLLQHYHAHTTYLRFQVAGSPTSSRKRFLQQQILEWEPADIYTRMAVMQDLLKPPKVAELMAHVNVLDRYTSRTELDQLSAILPPNFLTQMMSRANSIARTEPEKALQLTLFVYHLQPWQINEIPTYFLLSPETFPVHMIDKLIMELQPQDLWAYGRTLGPWYIRRSILAAQRQQWSQASEYTHWVQLTATWHSRKIWQELSGLFHSQLMDHIAASDCASADTLLRSWRTILQQIAGSQFILAGESQGQQDKWYDQYHPDWWQDYDFQQNLAKKVCPKLE